MKDELILLDIYTITAENILSENVLTEVIQHHFEKYIDSTNTPFERIKEGDMTRLMYRYHNTILINTINEIKNILSSLNNKYLDDSDDVTLTSNTISRAKNIIARYENIVNYINKNWRKNDTED